MQPSAAGQTATSLPCSQESWGVLFFSYHPNWKADLQVCILTSSHYSFSFIPVKNAHYSSNKFQSFHKNSCSRLYLGRIYCFLTHAECTWLHKFSAWFSYTKVTFSVRYYILIVNKQLSCSSTGQRWEQTTRSIPVFPASEILSFKMDCILIHAFWGKKVFRV